MASIIHNKMTLLSLLIVGVALASYAFMPAAAFADKGGIPHHSKGNKENKKGYFKADEYNNDYHGPKFYHYKPSQQKKGHDSNDNGNGYYNHAKRFFKYKHDIDYYANVKIIIHNYYPNDYHARNSDYSVHHDNEDYDNNDGTNYVKFYDEHFKDHMYDDEGRFYYDDDGNEYQCDDYYDGSVYYDYDGAFYKCDDLTASEDFEAEY